MGIFVMLISLVGCIGAKRESRLILGIYAVILVILIICQIAVGIAVYANQSEAVKLLTLGWNAAAPATLVLIQNYLQCCGLTVYNLTAAPGMPASAYTGLAAQPCPDRTLYPSSVGQTCLPLMVQQIQSSYVTVGIVAIVFAVLQVRRC